MYQGACYDTFLQKRSTYPKNSTKRQNARGIIVRFAYNAKRMITRQYKTFKELGEFAVLMII